ncbi:MAG: PorT family protein [Prevotellaceae bacterium]|jgi:hypothetical protein|nr:PorT family protein [Prevotellaceae bacterium]
MKKIIILLAALVVAINADAQIKLGLKAGLDFSEMSFSSAKNSDESNKYTMDAKRTGWHLGMAMKMSFPLLPITLQPELLFSTKGAKDVTLNYIEIPVNLQWGISIGKIRPYAELSPYFSYLVGSNKPLESLNTWDGGLGLGLGIDIWKLQISAKYVWGLGKVADIKGVNEEVVGSFKNRITRISIGYFL